MRNIIISIFLLLALPLQSHAQVIGLKKLPRLTHNPDFIWSIDTLESNVFIYTENDSYANRHKTFVGEKIKQHIGQTLSFIGIEKYDGPIHYFLIDNRQKMRSLVGWETNGTAHYKENYVVAIHSERIKMAYSNHELFHLMAMNEWGKPQRWINEGMAVLADGHIHDYPLHELAKYIIDQHQYIALDKLSGRLKKYRSRIAYPLLGSFAQYIEERYGRETTKIIWKTGRKGLAKPLGKDLNDLEKEWLEMLESVTYADIDYLR